MGSHLLRRPPPRRSHSRPPRRTRLVQVDGRIVDLNCELSPGDRVTVGGQPVTLPEPRICPWAAQRPAWGGGVGGLYSEMPFQLVFAASYRRGHARVGLAHTGHVCLDSGL